MNIDGGAGLKLTVARYYTPLGRMIHKNFKAKNPDETGGILPDMVVNFDINKEHKAVLYGTNLVYSPSKNTITHDESLKTQDIVLDRALEIIKARKSLGALAAFSEEQKELKAKENKQTIEI